MTAVRPFRALRYDTDRVDLSRVIVPPYDVIAGDERGAFFDRDPHNAIRFELTREVEDEAVTDYGEIRETLDAWRREGVLVPDERPAFYVMRQRFEAPDGRALERIGFFAELQLEDYEKGIVRPHEYTMAGPKADRLKLLRAARSNLSSVFMLYEDKEQILARVLERALATRPLGTAVDGAGVEYALAAVDRDDDGAVIRDFLATRPVVIADGHHRYETALAYRDEMRAATGSEGGPFESTLAYFANAYAPDSLLLPIHRVVKQGVAPTREQWAERLPGWKQESVRLAGSEDIADALERHLAPHAGQPAFAVDDAGGELLILWQDEALSDLIVRVIEREVLAGVFDIDAGAIRDGAVSFPKSAGRAAREVREGQGVVALYLNPLLPEDVFRVTAAGERMPQKSTFFAPKVPTGLVFRDHEPEGARR